MHTGVRVTLGGAEAVGDAGLFLKARARAPATHPRNPSAKRGPGERERPDPALGCGAPALTRFTSPTGARLLRRRERARGGRARAAPRRLLLRRRPPWRASRPRRPGGSQGPARRPRLLLRAVCCSRRAQIPTACVCAQVHFVRSFADPEAGGFVLQGELEVSYASQARNPPTTPPPHAPAIHRLGGC